MNFTPFPKMGRLTRDCVITEKIDGTNAQIVITPVEDYAGGIVIPSGFPKDPMRVSAFWIVAGSRTRYITPQDDNFGFAAWVRDNAEELVQLGPGQHFGEWWGGKIQRGYGLKERQFSLFNTGRWADRNGHAEVHEPDYETHQAQHFERFAGQEWAPACCRVVPVLYRGLFGEGAANGALHRLKTYGSMAAPGFMNPEGIVIYHTAVGTMFKKTLEKDEQPKGVAA